MSIQVTNNIFKFQVTDNAFKRIYELIELENTLNYVLRIAVNGGGCSGFSYHYELVPDTTITNDDYLISNNKVSVIIDSTSQQFLHESILDFIETLGSSYFEIRNPTAKTKCGCGNSFSI